MKNAISNKRKELSMSIAGKNKGRSWLSAPNARDSEMVRVNAVLLSDIFNYERIITNFLILIIH